MLPNIQQHNLGMKWYHFFKWYLIFSLVGGPLVMFSDTIIALTSIQMSLSDFVKFSLEFAPIYIFTSFLTFIVNVVLLAILAKKLFKYEPYSYKWCGIYLIAVIAQFFICGIAGYSEMAISATTTEFIRIALLLIPFSLTYFYLKKRNMYFLLGITSSASMHTTAIENETSCDNQFCPHCGKSIFLDSTFCTYCGKQVRNKDEI